MKYYLVFALILAFAFPLYSQSSDKSNKVNFFQDVIVSEDFAGSAYWNELDTTLESKYYEVEFEYVSNEIAQPVDAKVAAFLKRYDAKIKAAVSNAEYQKKISGYKTASAPFVHYGADIDQRVKEVSISLDATIGKFSARVKKLMLPSYNKAFSDRYNAIISDDSASSRALSNYDTYIGYCIYGTISAHSCSYIASDRVKNILNIAKAAIDVEDMPMFYAAMNKLNENIDKNVKPSKLKYIFTNAAVLKI